MIKGKEMNKNRAEKKERKPSVFRDSATDNPIAAKAERNTSRNRQLAKQLRKTGQVVSLSAELSSVCEEINGMANMISHSATQGRGALEKVISNIAETAYQSEQIADTTDILCDTTTNVFSAIDTLNLTIEDNDTVLSEIVDKLTAAAQGHSEIKTGIDTLMKMGRNGEKLIETINQIVEHTDVAGLNASLEAGRIPGGNEGLTVLASQISKTTQIYEQAAIDFRKRISELQDGSQATAENVEETGERIRTISVMTKGVKNAYDDVVTALSDVSQHAESQSVKTLETFSGQDTFPSGSQKLADKVRDRISMIENTLNALKDLAGSFSSVYDLSGVISDESVRLASDELPKDALDTIFTAAEDLLETVSENDAEFDTVTARFLDTAVCLEELEREIELISENLDVIAANSTDILDTSGDIEEKLNAIQKNIAGSKPVFHNLTTEISALIEDIKAFYIHILTLGVRIQKTSRFIHKLSTMSSRIDTISLTCELELARTANTDTGFSNIPGRLDSLSAELAKAALELEDYLDTLEQQSANVAVLGNDVDWQTISETVNEFLHDAVDAEDSIIPSAVESAQTTVSSIQKLIKHVDNVRDRMKDVMVSSESAASLVREAGELAGNQKVLFGRIAEIGSKLLVQTEALYPEEE